MRFRQVHLDFHTSEKIGQIGVDFSKEQFQSMLRRGHVDSITVFSKCHHGWAYHPSEANEMHPGLSFDLLGAMIEAAHEIGVNTPVYLSAGLDEKLAWRHPEWLVRNRDQSTTWAADFQQAGYHSLCMNTPYLDILVAQIEEVVQRYDADGIFLDIVGVRECYCNNCVQTVIREGGDPRDEEAMAALWERTYRNYAMRTNEAVHKHKPELPVFHNGGNIIRGRRDLAGYNTHLELESLPTGGWGYDHFPLSARYAQTIGMDYLGMTGKFHTTWGEFGGYKHPNALRYEAALSVANGARCSIGDQLHPRGRMDEATYALIGEAYGEVEAKEAWCVGVESVADVALLSAEAQFSGASKHRDNHPGASSDVGALRMLLEGKLLFDVIDNEADFAKYKIVILPDVITVDDKLSAKLDALLQAGGKVLATGRSGLASDGSRFALKLGAEWKGVSGNKPSYFRPAFPIAGLPAASYIMYSEAQIVEPAAGAPQYGVMEHSYFNRDLLSFCSHQHAPSTMEAVAPGMTEGEHGIYFAWNVFQEYAEKGSLSLRESVLFAIRKLLAEPTLTTNLPAQGIVTLQSQPKQSRWVQHTLYASPVKRGKGIEIIEDVLPLYDVAISVRVPQPVRRLYLAPSMEELPFEQQGETVSYVLPKLVCHQMAVLEFGGAH